MANKKKSKTVQPTFDLGDRIKQAIENAGMSIRELGDKVDRHEQTVYKWLRNDPMPSIDQVREIARATGQEFLWFLKDEATPPAPRRPEPTLLEIYRAEADGDVLIGSFRLDTDNEIRIRFR